MRVAEAERAKGLAEQAGVKLLDSLQRHNPAAVTETDFDRLEAATFDLERRVWAARDAAERCGKPVNFAKEIEQLDHQAHAWLDYVQTNRATDFASQIEKLQALLR
jgi:hypothetical protein